MRRVQSAPASLTLVGLMRWLRAGKAGGALRVLVAVLAVGAALYVIPALPFVPRSEADLKFSVIDEVGPPLVCTGWGMPNPAFSPYQDYLRIVADLPTYQAILRRLHLLPGPLTADQIVAVYRQWLDLNAVRLDWQGGVYAFDVYPGPTPSEALRNDMVGDVDVFGRVYNVHQGTKLGACPICLPGTSLISTPTGDLAVAGIRVGMHVWSVTRDGHPVDAVVIEARTRLDAPGSRLIHVVLADGRQLTASPPHPIADGRMLGSLKVGDYVDGVGVVRVEAVPDLAGRTFDLLPAGPTGEYWAGGILLRSTLQPSAGS